MQSQTQTRSFHLTPTLPYYAFPPNPQPQSPCSSFQSSPLPSPCPPLNNPHPHPHAPPPICPTLIPMLSLPMLPIPMSPTFFLWLSLTFHWLSPTLSYCQASPMHISAKVILFCIFPQVQVDFCQLKNLTFLDLCKHFDFIWLFLTNVLFFWLSLTFLFLQYIMGEVVNELFN